MRMKNNDLLNAYINYNATEDMTNYSSNLYITKPYFLVNYDTIIAIYYEGKIYVSDRKYSATTSKHQNYLVRSGAERIPHETFENYINLIRGR